MNTRVGIAVEKVHPFTVHIADYGPVILVAQQNNPVRALVKPLLALREDAAGGESGDAHKRFMEREGPATPTAGLEETQQCVKLVRFSADGQADSDVIVLTEPADHRPEKGFSSHAWVEPVKGIHHAVKPTKGIEFPLHGRPQGFIVFLFHMLSHC